MGSNCLGYLRRGELFRGNSLGDGEGGGSPGSNCPGRIS